MWEKLCKWPKLTSPLSDLVVFYLLFDFYSCYSSFRTDDDDELSDDLLDEDDELEKAQIILPLRDKKGTVGGNVKFSCRAQSIPKNTPIDWPRDV